MNSKKLEARIVARIETRIAVLFLLFLSGFLFAMPHRETSPRNTGELRFGLMSEPATLDPLSPSNTADGRIVLFNVFEGLVKPDTTGRLLPAAAESFEMSRDARVYTFTLREGLRFNNGSTVSIEDAEFTLSEAKKTGAPGFDQIQRIDLLGNRRIAITLSAADPEFLPYLSMGIVPKNNLDREKNPIGVGPYIIESYTPQQQLVLAKNPYYWQPDLPKLDRVTVLFAADNNALYTGLEGGNLTGAMVSGDVAQKLDTRRFEIVESYSNSIQLLALNNVVAPLDDVRVRRALNYAIDPREIIDTAFYGKGEISGSPLIPGLSLYYNEALRNPYPADIAKAKALLAEAGFWHGFNLEIKVPSNYSMHIDTAQVIVNQLTKIDVRATIRLVDWATWLTDVYRNRNYEATIISLDGPTVSPKSFLSRYVSSSSSNFLNFKNDAYDHLFDNILREADEERRILLYKEAQKLVSDEAAGVYIQDIFAFKVFSGGFRGVLNYPLYVFDFSTIYRN